MAWGQVGNIRGPQGPAGVGVTYRDTLNDATELPTTGMAVGDMYVLLDTGHAHIYNAGGTWDDAGPWLGPEGPQGTAGVRGSLWFNGNNTVAELNSTNPIAGSRPNDHYLHLGNGDVYMFS